MTSYPLKRVQPCFVAIIGLLCYLMVLLHPLTHDHGVSGHFAQKTESAFLLSSADHPDAECDICRQLHGFMPTLSLLTVVILTGFKILQPSAQLVRVPASRCAAYCSSRAPPHI